MAEDQPIQLWDDDVPTVTWTTSFRALYRMVLPSVPAAAVVLWFQERPETTGQRLEILAWPVGMAACLLLVAYLLGGRRRHHSRVDGSGITLRGRHTPAVAIGEVLVLRPEQAREVMGDTVRATAPLEFEGRRISRRRSVYRYGDDQDVLVFEELLDDGRSTYHLSSLPEGLSAAEVAAVLRQARDRANGARDERAEGGRA
jgi:hypothetical protein